MTSNMSFDADSHRQHAARRADKPTPCGTLPLRAGQLGISERTKPTGLEGLERQRT